MKKYSLSCLTKVYKTNALLLLAPLMLIMNFSGRSQAQCACTPLNETFGSTANCAGFAQSTSNSAIKNHSLVTYSPGGANNDPNDGRYSIRCDGDENNAGWFGGGGTTMSDHTADAAGQYGNYTIINSAAGPTEFYHNTVTGLCASTTYTLTYYAGNIVRDNSYGMLPSLQTYVFPAGTAVTGIGAFSATGGTLLGSSGGISSTSSATGFVWNTYSYSFTTGAGVTSIDVVLASLNGNNAGGDFAFDDVTITKTSGVGCTLPVELLSFRAEELTQNVVLKWSTSSEVNFSYFSIEKSEDGIIFNEIGKVSGTGNSSDLLNYGFEDNYFTHSCYYRLKMMDKDGSFQFSKILFLSTNEGNSAWVVNNGSDPRELEIKGISKEDTEWNIEIYSVLGRIYMNTKVQLQKGENNLLKKEYYNVKKEPVVCKITAPDGEVILQQVIFW